MIEGARQAERIDGSSPEPRGACLSPTIRYPCDENGNGVIVGDFENMNSTVRLLTESNVDVEKSAFIT